MAQKVLVVGENSFIAKHLLTYDKVSYYNFNEVDLSKYDAVINCALNPLYKSKSYNEEYDVDYLYTHLPYSQREEKTRLYHLGYYSNLLQSYNPYHRSSQ